MGSKEYYNYPRYGLEIAARGRVFWVKVLNFGETIIVLSAD
jgi:hypothetical protein